MCLNLGDNPVLVNDSYKPTMRSGAMLELEQARIDALSPEEFAREVRGWTSDENLRHQIEGDQLDYMVGWLLRDSTTLPGGFTPAMIIEHFTKYMMLWYLEGLVQNDEFWAEPRQPFDWLDWCRFRADIAAFLRETNKYGWMTGDDIAMYGRPEIN